MSVISLMLTSLPVPRPSVVFCEVEDGAVLLHVEDEVYFSLSDVAVKIWQLLPPATSTFSELCDALCGMYPDAPPDVVREDAGSLIAELVANRLAEPQAPQPS